MENVEHSNTCSLVQVSSLGLSFESAPRSMKSRGKELFAIDLPCYQNYNRGEAFQLKAGLGNIKVAVPGGLTVCNR